MVFVMVKPVHSLKLSFRLKISVRYFSWKEFIKFASRLSKHNKIKAGKEIFFNEKNSSLLKKIKTIDIITINKKNNSFIFFFTFAQKQFLYSKLNI